MTEPLIASLREQLADVPRLPHEDAYDVIAFLRRTSDRLEEHFTRPADDHHAPRELSDSF